MQLGTVATSTPSERTFKSASFIYTTDRPMLNEENVEYMVMIRQNYSLLKRYSLDELLDMLIKEGFDVDTHLDLNFCPDDDDDIDSSEFEELEGGTTM
jgi:hypothetical protein